MILGRTISRTRAIHKLRQRRKAIRPGACIVRQCTRKLDSFGDLCNLHGKLYRRYGHATLKSISWAQLRAYSEAARGLLEGDSVLAEVETLLTSCPAIKRQADVHSRYSSADRAKAVLAFIHRQRKERAALDIVSTYVAASVIPKASSAPLYARVQCGRAVFHLLKSEPVTLWGKVRRVRISGQGYRLMLSISSMLDKILWPVVRESRRKIIENVNGTGRAGS